MLTVERTSTELLAGQAWSRVDLQLCVCCAQDSADREGRVARQPSLPTRAMLDCHADTPLSTRLGETLMLHASNASDPESVRLSDAWSVAMPPRAVRRPRAMPVD